MIDVTPFINKLDRLGEYIDLVIMKVENEYWIKEFGKLNFGYSGSKYYKHNRVLQTSSYMEPNGWIIPFEEWLQLTTN